MTFFWEVLFGIWRAGRRRISEASTGEEEESSCKMEKLELIIIKGSGSPVTTYQC